MPTRTFDGSLTDVRRTRTIAYRVYYPAGWRGPLPVVLFSHGGDGSTNGHTQLGHFGTEWASTGFLAVHLNHLPSATISQHDADRPADVTAILDRLEARSLPLPADNSWRELSIPSFVLVGADEKNGPLGDPQQLTDWRLYPYERAPAAPARFLAVLPGQGHGAMAGGAEPAQRYLRLNTRRFLQVFLQGREALVCDIGRLTLIPGTDLRRKTDPSWSAVRECPPLASNTVGNVSAETR